MIHQIDNIGDDEIAKAKVIDIDDISLYTSGDDKSNVLHDFVQKTRSESLKDCKFYDSDMFNNDMELLRRLHKTSEFYHTGDYAESYCHLVTFTKVIQYLTNAMRAAIRDNFERLLRKDA
jgi:hypothetical protein